METIKLTWYQSFFNQRFGYRKDYKASFLYYINQYIKRYLLDIYYYHDGNKEPYTKSVQVKGPRGGNTGQYKNIVIPTTKDTVKALKLTFFSWTWLSFSIEFRYSTYVFRKLEISFCITNLKLTFDFAIKNI